MFELPRPCRELDVERLVASFLRRQGYEVSEKVRHPSGVIDLVATKAEEVVVIEAKREDRGGYTSAEMNFQMAIGQIACRMDDPRKRYAVAFPFTSDFAKVLAKYRGTSAFARLELYALVVKPDGDVRLMDPSAFQAFIDSSDIP